MGFHVCAYFARKPVNRKDQQQAAESSTQYATRQAAQQHAQPAGCSTQCGMGGAKISVIALHVNGRKAGNDDRCQQGAVGTFFERARHLLDGKHNACQRRIEGGGHACTATGNDQAPFHDVTGKTDQPAQVVQQGCADLDGRAFTPNAGPARQAHAGQQHLAQRQPQRQHIVAVGAVRHADGGNGLRDAAALRALEVALGQGGHAGKRQGRDQQGQPGGNGNQFLEQHVRIVAAPGKGRRGQAHDDRAAPEQHMTHPQAE